MGEAAAREVDRIAARNLLSTLGIEPTHDALEHATRTLAEHRVTGADWAANRVHRDALEMLEEDSMLQFAGHAPEWSEGFIAAQQSLLRLEPIEKLGLYEEKPRSKGQILRTMVRLAKERAA